MLELTLFSVSRIGGNGKDSGQYNTDNENE